MNIRFCTAASLILLGSTLSCNRSDVPIIVDEESPFSAEQPSAPPPCMRDTDTAKRSWERFRAQFPFHYQTVAMSRPFQEGCRTLIISEPPPHASLPDIQALDSRIAEAITTYRHAVGYDGWTTDIVVVIPPLSASEMSELTSSLHQYLFGTSYKAYLTEITGIPAPVSAPNMDLKVTPAEIHEWLLRDGATVEPLDGGPPVRVSEAMSASSSKVYFTSTPGLVAWAIPRSVDIRHLAAEARQFAVESDIIVGAYATASTVLVLGRERATAVDALPPLRFETLVLLASASTSELAQSYERNHIFAGRLEKGTDWAPIHLSPELIDTEYGSLLNITDQLLKSWSNLGMTKYANFTYPDPRQWPFDQPAPRLVSGDSLIYNWNTSHFAAKIDLGSSSILAFRRTGTHSVTYLPDEKRTDATAKGLERLAYDYFAQTGDTNIARTVQYTALYHIFHELKIKTNNRPLPVDDSATAAVLERHARRMLRDLADADPKRRREAASRIVASITREAPLPAAAERVRAIVDAKLSGYQDLLKRMSERELHRLAAIIAAPRRFGQYIDKIRSAPRTRQIDLDVTVSVALGLLARDLADASTFLQGFMSPDKVKDEMVEAGNHRNSQWMHTPTVVVSHNTGNMAGAVGGHNIKVDISTMNLVDQRPGQGPGSGHINQGRLRRLTLGPRGIEESPRELPVRSASVALRLGSATTKRERRGFEPPRTPGGEDTQLGWRPATTQAEPCGPGCIRVVREERGYTVSLPSGHARHAVTTPDVIEAMLHHLQQAPPSKDPFVLQLPNLTPKEARGFIKSAERRGHSNAIAIIGKPGQDVDAALRTKYDLSRAKVHDVQFKRYSDGTSELGVAIEIPRDSKPSLWVRIKMFFSTVVPEAMQARVIEVTERVRSRFTGEVTAKQLAFELRSEIRAAIEESGGDHEIVIDTETGDIHIVRRDPPAAPSDHDGRLGIPA